MIEINSNIIFYLLIFVLGAAAIIVFSNVRPKSKIVIRKNRYRQFKNLVESNVSNQSIDSLMDELDIGLSFGKYQGIRWSFFIAYLLLNVTNVVLRNASIQKNQIILLIVVFLLSTPRQTIMGRKAPFIYLIEMIANGIKKERNAEIYRAISQLKNLAIARQNNPPSADFILEQLRKFSKKTRPIFNQMIYLWSMGKREEACHYFSTKIGTPEAEELAGIFLKLEDLNPIELKNQLILYQDKIKKQRETQKMKDNENKSNMVYALVIASLMIILVNFLIVGFYIDNLNLFKYRIQQ